MVVTTKLAPKAGATITIPTSKYDRLVKSAADAKKPKPEPKPAGTSVPLVNATEPKVEPKLDPKPEPKQTLQPDPADRIRNVSLVLAASAFVLALAVFLTVGPGRTWLGGLGQQQATNATGGQQGSAPAGTCIEPNTVYVAAVDGCVKHVTDAADLKANGLPDIKVDPKCKGKPPGFKYDKPTVRNDGAPGVAHQVCGHRSS